MDLWSLLLASILLFFAAWALMYMHVRSWRRAQLADHTPNELDFYRRQYRRRMQSSAMLGVLAVIIFAGELLARWIHSPLFFTFYLALTLLLVLWVVALAGVDIWATQHHFGQLRQKCLIEQAKLQAEIRRVQAVRGNGKPLKKKETTEDSLDSGQ